MDSESLNKSLACTMKKTGIEKFTYVFNLLGTGNWELKGLDMNPFH